MAHLDRYFHHYVGETKLMAFLINARKIINEKNYLHYLWLKFTRGEVLPVPFNIAYCACKLSLPNLI